MVDCFGEFIGRVSFNVGILFKEVWVYCGEIRCVWIVKNIVVEFGGFEWVLFFMFN